MLLGIVGDTQLREGLVSGFLLIFFSEIGDKTFFIALLLALKQPRAVVFAGTLAALSAMTIISAVLGRAFHRLDEYISAPVRSNNCRSNDPCDKKECT